jgi:hypothetical protein
MGDIGIHMFAVLQDKTTGPSGYENSMIISLSNGVDVRQYGPNLTTTDKQEISRLLNKEGRAKVSGDIIWHAVELKRILKSDQLIFPLKEVRAHRQFKVWQFYDNSAENRAQSKDIAKLCAQGLQRGKLLDDTLLYPCASSTIEVKASQRLIQRYEENLPLFRLKWLEIQGLSHELKAQEYELEITEITADDEDKFGKE